MQYEGSGVDLHAVPGETGVVGGVSEKAIEAKKGRRMRNVRGILHSVDLEAMLV